jgi:hypothetical protein
VISMGIDSISLNGRNPDPLHGIKLRLRRGEPSTSSIKQPKHDPTNLEKTEKLLRERSIRSNRRHKFVDCLTSQDVNIGVDGSIQSCCFCLDLVCYSRITQAGMGRYPS